MAQSFGQIWQTLSALDISAKVVEKPGTGNPSYLSWGDAWGLLMQSFPNADYRFLCSDHRYQGDELFEAPDGSAEVRCEVTIEGCRRDMWLPIMDHKFNAVFEPDARDVSDAKMRCLVKCLALFGLGHSLYAKAKEDVPDESRQPRSRGGNRGSARSGGGRGQGRGADDNRSRPSFPREAKEPLKVEELEAAIAALEQARNLDDLNTFYDDELAKIKRRGDLEAQSKLFDVYDRLAGELEGR